MQEPSKPDDEQERLKALRALKILDTPAEERLDRFTRIAKAMFNVPIALISLVDANRQWFKSKQGLAACETPRHISFCGHAILRNEIFYIPDTLEDIRFSDNPLVLGEPFIRSYVGVPLLEPDGFKIGTLCIIDSKPRNFTDEQLESLKDIAACIQRELRRFSLVQAAQAVMDGEASLHAVFEAVMDGILTIDQEGIIQQVNPAGLELFGYSENELLQQNVKILMPAPYQSEHDGYLQNYLRTGTKKVIGVGREVLGLRKDGSTFPMELSVAEVKGVSDGNKRLFTGVVRDVTERKHAEEMKAQFVSTVSHELRTPLTSIRGSLSLVLGKMKSVLTPKAIELLEMAERNSERLTFLINDLLDLEKMSAGQLEFEFAEVNLIELCKRAVTDNQGYAEQQNVTLSFVPSTLMAKAAIPVDDGVMVWGDENRLLQVLANLISNAAKFSDSAGAVEVSIEQIENGYRVSVSDHGPGIASEFRGKIFQRFAQADSSDVHRGRGSGLGLSISKSIIEHHKGKIDYSTELGKGSVFYFELPNKMPNLDATP